MTYSRWVSKLILLFLGMGKFGIKDRLFITKTLKCHFDPYPGTPPFVVAVLIQSETGGKLVDILKNTATLIRERQKIAGVVRVLSAEGTISATILSIMPFAVAGALSLINPGFIAILWTDPMGVKIAITALCMMIIGIFWMWRLVKIRV